MTMDVEEPAGGMDTIELPISTLEGPTDTDVPPIVTTVGWTPTEVDAGLVTKFGPDEDAGTGACGGRVD